MIVEPQLLQEIYEEAGETRKQKAEKIVNEKKVNITKVIYDNSLNFEVSSKVIGNSDTYKVYIQVANGEIEDVSCTCLDYAQHYGSCKHIVATLKEFASKEEYVRLFTGINQINSNDNDISIYNNYNENKKNEKYKIFKQLINTFYTSNAMKEETNKNIALPHSIKIEPHIIYNSFKKNIKIEFKIGDKQLYKLRSLPEFYERMKTRECYTYGQKLSFIHEIEAFAPDSIEILKYILKYAEIIKYANEASSEYGYYGRTMSDAYITVSDSGMDELFEVLKNRSVKLDKDNLTTEYLFLDTMPKINFEVEKLNLNECKIKPNIDIYTYDVIEGKDYVYFLMDGILYRCDNEFKESTLKLLQVFRNNFTTEIKFNKTDLSQLFSVVFPKMKNDINIEKLDEEEIEKYIPKELGVKVYLDYDENNYITADLKFVYGDVEFNPISEDPKTIARDIVKENEVVEKFRKTQFLLEQKNNRLILVNEDAIYNFLANEIESYMQQFEVLVTDNFKQKEIKQPQIGTLGVRIENNLLKIDFSNVDFDVEELQDIMSRYKMKKKYYRLKNGVYLKLDENETMDFIENLTDGLQLDYKQISQGELTLPVFRSMYLDRLLENMNSTNIQKDTEYKNLVNRIEEKNVDTDVILPENLNAELRNYQKVGYQWLKVLDEYQFGGILADDMGLGKTIQLIAVIQNYIETQNKNKEKVSPSIVVCPSSLSLNWENEIKKFAPSIKTTVIQGGLEERTQRINTIKDYNVAITSYDLLKRDIEIYKECNYSFKYIIADEAQYIKNSNTQNAKAIKQINAQTKYALTGTPIENSLSELWSIFDFVMPGYLFNYRRFKELYETPIVKDEDKKSMRKLKMLIEPFILRRVKTEVLTELPDKTITILNNEMQEEQLKIYMSYMKNAKQQALNEITQNGIEKSQIKILALLMRLRQICCHPSLFIENYSGESSKLNQCIEVVEDAVASGHKILLFSGYTAMFEIIEKELKKRNIAYFKLTGQTKVSQRIELVDRFNKDDDIKVFLISLKAGGTGLNLTGADMVIHYDPWWNLSAENQATDRTYRIGQKKNVQVYKLITKNSIEERIFELQEKKAKLIDSMLSTNETFINKLSKEDIMELFK